MFRTGASNLKNERSLIKGCLEGNRVFQNQLYSIYAAKMMGVCLRYAKTKEDAEDILQEGFIQAFACIKQFKSNGTLEGWLRKIFVNCALQKLREKENNVLLIDIESLPETCNIACDAIEFIDAKLLLKCIQNLPAISRLVFNLYVFEGLKHKEIAQILKISEGTSKSNLFDARNNLKKQLKKIDYFFLENAANG
jgi:RNA polymerase sigma factor (sigma-70 family)